MERRRVMEEMAKLNGLKPLVWHEIEEVLTIENDLCYDRQAPDYLMDHNVVQWTIDQMSVYENADYERQICNLTSDNFSKATCSQKCEAILKVYVKWED